MPSPEASNQDPDDRPTSAVSPFVLMNSLHHMGFKGDPVPRVSASTTKRSGPSVGHCASSFKHRTASRASLQRHEARPAITATDGVSVEESPHGDRSSCSGLSGPKAHMSTSSWTPNLSLRIDITPTSSRRLRDQVRTHTTTIPTNLSTSHPTRQGETRIRARDSDPESSTSLHSISISP